MEEVNLRALRASVDNLTDEVERLKQSLAFVGLIPHAHTHELTGSDIVRLAIQNNGTGLNRYRSLNFQLGLEAAEDSANKRINVSLGAPAVRVYNSGNVSIPDSAETAVTWDTEDFDTDGSHSVSANTSRLTAPIAGTYIIMAKIGWAAHATGLRNVVIRYNGATRIDDVVDNPPGASTFRQAIITSYHLAAGDYVECMAWQSSGGALNVERDANRFSWFSMVWQGT